MLALVRKPGQSLRIGDGVLSVTLLEISRGRAKVRLITELPIWPMRGASGARLGIGSQTVSCYRGDGFRIGANIVVSVVRVERGRVTFGIEADRGISIDREEIYLRKQQERTNSGA